MNNPKKDPKPQDEVLNAYRKYLKCLQDCKGDIKCEDRCGKRWEDVIYNCIYRFKLFDNVTKTQK